MATLQIAIIQTLPPLELGTSEIPYFWQFLVVLRLDSYVPDSQWPLDTIVE